MGISQYPFGSQGNLRRKRNCLHEIATAPSGPRNDKSGNLHGRRNCFKICNCQWRSVSAATDAIGLCVFAGSLYELQVPAVFRLRILPPVRQRMRNRQNFGKFLCFFIMACYNESAE